MYLENLEMLRFKKKKQQINKYWYSEKMYRFEEN